MGAGRRAISMEEVKKHNTADDCWMVVHGLVVNLPKDFLDDHPGGPEVVLELAGQDATEAFEDIGHSDMAREWNDKYIIGYLEGEEDKAAAEKLTPKQAEIAALRKKSGGGGGFGALLPAVGVAALAGIAFFLLKMRR
eukprot:TRINITY_DN12567_c0_g1_i1.p1 TRINITY_DN12567_c0_g1~~TRINITY_DN12567_c0_g1_i1.p1  ORF type:complete len:138 (-),score=50.36 TRINITY_DN12567_c0_g1_i1:329-742(-)